MKEMIDRLSSGVILYGHHTQGCPIYRHAGHACRCGFRELLEYIGELETEVFEDDT